MIKDNDLDMVHRWVNFVKSGESKKTSTNSSVIPNRFSVDSLGLIDNSKVSMALTLTVSNKFISKKHYFVPVT